MEANEIQTVSRTLLLIEIYEGLGELDEDCLEIIRDQINTSIALNEAFKMLREAI